MGIKPRIITGNGRWCYSYHYHTASESVESWRVIFEQYKISKLFLRRLKKQIGVNVANVPSVLKSCFTHRSFMSYIFSSAVLRYFRSDTLKYVFVCISVIKKARITKNRSFEHLLKKRIRKFTIAQNFGNLITIVIYTAK
jgi:hypothetical protein